MVDVSLRGGQAVIDRESILLDEMRHDRIAVAYRLAVIDDVGELPARRVLRVEDVLVLEGEAAQPQEREDLQPERTVVGDAIELGIGDQSYHQPLLRSIL